jgi:hypothetical protein
MKYFGLGGVVWEDKPYWKEMMKARIEYELEQLMDKSDEDWKLLDVPDGDGELIMKVTFTRE